MKENIIEIERLATFLFADNTYNKFINYTETNQINEARLMVEDEIDNNSNSIHQNIVAGRLQDLLMDLIINEMDGERENKQIKSSTG